MLINDDTMRLIWAQSSKDPKQEENGEFSPAYHIENRGIRSIFLKVDTQHVKFPEETEDGKIIDPNVKAWDVVSKNVS